MARGRLTQLRLHAVQQAALVWAEVGPEQVDQFVRTGRMDEAMPERIPYDPAVLQELQART